MIGIKWNSDRPPSSRTTPSHRYATTIPKRLFGITHRPSHLRLNLSCIPQIANPYCTSLSWPSQHHTSLGPSEVNGTLHIRRDVGFRASTAAGLSIRCTSATVSLEMIVIVSDVKGTSRSLLAFSDGCQSSMQSASLQCFAQLDR
jgi:hypothetical protein